MGQGEGMTVNGWVGKALELLTVLWCTSLVLGGLLVGIGSRRRSMGSRTTEATEAWTGVHAPRPLDQDYRFGHPGTDSIAEPRLRCNVFALLSRSILLSSPVRLQIGSGQGVPATPAATLPTPLRPCLSATPRSGCPALAALPSGHRQRPDPAQHVTEQPPVQMSLGQQQPVVAGMFDQTAAGLH